MTAILGVRSRSSCPPIGADMGGGGSLRGVFELSLEADVASVGPRGH